LMRQHPQLFLPEHKEPHFFTGCQSGLSSLGLQTPERWITDPEVYANLFAAANAKQRLGEASTTYLRFPELVVPRLQEAYGDRHRQLKILIVLRNPIDRAYSHYQYLVRNGHETLPFEQALDPDVIRQREQERWGFNYLATGMYREQVEAYRKVFPQVKVWLFEELRDAAALTAEVWDFLEVGPHRPKAVAANPSGVPRHRGVTRFTVGDHWVKRALKAVLPACARQQLRTQKHRLLQQQLEKQPMSEEARAFLTGHYKEEINHLQDLLQRDLTHWLTATP
ncbi:MAG: hypothetical protein AAGB22_09900, partial [Bacteroidota bacterium]